MGTAMKPRTEQIGKIEEAFKAAYRSEEAIPVSPAWENKVMEGVRRSAKVPPMKYFDPEAFRHLVWRFAAATCLFVLALTVYAMSSDFGSASDVTKVFFENPLAIDVIHTLESL